VISELKLDTKTDPNTMMEVLDTGAANPHTGFNVDGRFSDTSDMQGCGIPDFYAKDDLDQHSPDGCAMATSGCKGGVDNQLLSVAEGLAVAAGDINALAKQNIDQSKLVILMRVEDVNNLTNDPSVSVKLYLGFPAFSTGCTSVMPNRDYKVSSASLTMGTDIANARFSFDGKIEAGRLKVSRMGRFDLPLPPIMGQTLNLAINNTQLRFNLTADAGDHGNIGGWVKGKDIRDAVVQIAPDQTSLIDSLLPTFLDVVDPSNTASPMDQCINASGQPPEKWGGISLGFGLKITKANINPVAAAAADPGVCGNQGGSGG